MVRFGTMLTAPRLPIAVAMLGSAAAMLLASCSSSGAPAGVRGGAQPVSAQEGSAGINITPSDRSDGVRLDSPVVVSVQSGRLQSVTLQEAGANGPLIGNMSQAGDTWRYVSGLDSNAHYTVVVTARGTNGQTSTAQASFGTLTASDRLITSVSPGDGSTVGIGETIDLKFNTAIPDDRKAALLQRIQVTSTPGVLGAWHWLNDSTVHFRTRDFWPSGAQVNVVANLQGFDAGGGVWGLGGWTHSFTVGAKHLSLIDSNTHQMQVFENDQLIHTWPVSLGKTGFETIDGTLTVLYKVYDVEMKSCQTFGGAACIEGSQNWYDGHVFYDTAISTSGFYIHAAPWSVGSQGYANVSHGCVNLSTDRAITFYNWSLVGDVVQIKNTGNLATYASGEGDWQIDFSQYSNTSGLGAVWTGTPSVSSPSGRVF